MEVQKMLKVVLVIAFGLPSVLGRVQEMPIPVELEECLLYKSLNVSVADVPGKLIEDFCLQNYALNHYDENAQRNISAEGINYLESLFRQINAETRMTRKKRQARPTWRIRSEIRTLSTAQRNRIFGCLNRLKRDYSIDRSINTYDLIGSLHSAQAARFMHNGPGFLGRHAIYLLVMETACRTPIPYWDFTMDGEMGDPTSSAVWSNAFFGNGNGAVRTGFCGNWVTPQNTPIIRNLGAGGVRIPGKQALRSLLSRTRTSEITEPQPAMSVFSIEVHHNAVHNSIGGLFSGLDTSPFDPVFWFVHSMFNYIWLLFKNNQRARGIDPQRDYPRGPNVPQGHEFFQRLNFRPFFRPMTNLETFSDRFDRIVRYTPLPTCPQCGGNPFLVCLRGVCVARSRGPGAAVGVVPGVIRPGVVARRVVIPRAPVLIRGKRSIYTNKNIDEKRSTLIQSHDEAISTLDQSYRNTFIVNGQYAPKDWVYLNVRVLYERPRNVNFKTTDLGDANLEHDPSSFHDAGEKIGIKDRVLYKQKCEPAGSGATKVFVESNGLNYHGKYKEFSILDERQAVSSAIIQVAVRKPSDNHTEALLSAYDSCGRVCRPACPVSKRPSTLHKACSGNFKITTEYPLMYSYSYEAAISSLWHLSLDGKGPLFRNTISPVTFICDHKNTWPWSRT